MNKQFRNYTNPVGKTQDFIAFLPSEWCVKTQSSNVPRKLHTENRAWGNPGVVTLALDDIHVIESKHFDLPWCAWLDENDWSTHRYVHTLTRTSPGCSIGTAVSPMYKFSRGPFPFLINIAHMFDMLFIFDNSKRLRGRWRMWPIFIGNNCMIILVPIVLVSVDNLWCQKLATPLESTPIAWRKCITSLLSKCQDWKWRRTLSRAHSELQESNREVQWMTSGLIMYPYQVHKNVCCST